GAGDARGPADFEAQIFAFELLEALKLRVQLVRPRHQSAGDERAVLTRHRLAHHARLLVADHDGHTRQYGPLRVDDSPPKLRCSLLCRRRHGDEQGHQDRADYTLPHSDLPPELTARESTLLKQ